MVNTIIKSGRRNRSGDASTTTATPPSAATAKSQKMNVQVTAPAALIPSLADNDRGGP